MDKKILTPEESFELINKAISNFKMNYKEYGQSFLLWGWMICLACFSHFIIFKILQGKEAYQHIGLFSLGNWIVIMSAAFIIQFFMERKINKDKKVISHLEKFINILWWVIGASMVVATFLCIRLGIIPPPVFLLIGGIAITITGLVIKFKPVIIGGISLFLFSIASTFVSNENTLIIVGVAVICGYLIPGYLLKSAKE